MNDILLDTHAWAWSIMGDKRLSFRAVRAIEAADTVAVSAISLYEIGQKAMIGKWPEMLPKLTVLISIAEQQGVKMLPIGPKTSLNASILNWAHRDPFDRLIAATAMYEQRILISADIMFDDLTLAANWPGRLW